MSNKGVHQNYYYIITARDINSFGEKPTLLATPILALQHLKTLKAKKDKTISTYFRDESFNALLTNKEAIAQLELGNNLLVCEGNFIHFTCYSCALISK